MLQRFVRQCAGIGLIALAAAAARGANLQVVPTTTRAAETANNTSAPNGITSSTQGYAASGNISKLPIRSLMYPGATSKVYAALMGWFGKSGHIGVGYNSTDAAQVRKQVEDMQSRGIDGAILAWYGAGAYEDRTALALKAQAEAHPGFTFAIMVDQGTIQWNSMGMSPTDALIYHLNYVAQTYYPSSAYMRINGRPVVLEFGMEAWNIDWARVTASVQGNPVFIFRNPPAFTNTYAFGGYSWGPASGLSYTDYFNQIAQRHTDKIVMADGWKGFNDVLASWSLHRVLDQQCGQTWLNSLAELSKYYSSATPLPYLQIATWNDYEEGTTIESGIDNCLSVNASVAGTRLQWQLSGAGQENTVDHYTAYISLDGENLMPLADIPTGIYSLDLSPFNLGPGNYTLYVKAVGKASLKNQMSNAASFASANLPPRAVLSVTPNTGIAPVNVTASTTGSTDPDGTIASSQIDFGDGTIVSGNPATHKYASAGTYAVTATVTDNMGAAASATTTVTVAPASVTILLPPAPYNSAQPLRVQASAVSGLPITGMWVYLDNVGIYGNNATSLDIYVKIATGTHVIQVKAWDNTGHITSSSVTVNVTAPPPIPGRINAGTRSGTGTTTTQSMRLAGQTDTTVTTENGEPVIAPRASRLPR